MALNEAFLGLGSNLGHPASNIREALGLLGQHSRFIDISRLYRTTPQGFRNQPDFVNVACRMWTELDPFQLLDVALQIEKTVGRRRTFSNAPRTLDIDVLIYGKAVLQGPPLTVPHPRMHLRSFVLRPLMDIAPGLVHPVLGETVRSMLQQLPNYGESISQLV